MKTNGDIHVLDCTIRDGGHLNDWNFSRLCVKASYLAALNSGTGYFEAGYRTPSAKTGLGEFGYCADRALLEIIKPVDRCKIAIMINSGDYSPDLLIARDPEKTPVSAVRIAAYPYQLEKAFAAIGDAFGKGYEVFLNLMVFSELTQGNFAELAGWKEKDSLQAVYFADSFGSYTPVDISACCSKLRSLGFTSLGFHSHNNLQMAFANTLQAIQDGVRYIDASIYGMGRGAGNLPIEIISAYFEKAGMHRYNPVPYLDVIDRFYLGLMDRLHWGYSLESLMGGMKGVHPYYVENLFKRNTYTVNEIWNSLDRVKEKCPISYSPKSLDDTLQDRLYIHLGRDEANANLIRIEDELRIKPEDDAFTCDNSAFAGIHGGRAFLILASGPSIADHSRQLHDFIAQVHPVTIGLNLLPDGFTPDYHLFINKKRFIKYCGCIAGESRILVPDFFGRRMVKDNTDRTASYLHMEIGNDGDEDPVRDNIVRVSYMNVAITAILLARIMGADEIFVAGMDGYGADGGHEIKYFYDEQDVPEDKTISALRYGKLTGELARVHRYLERENVPWSIITPTSNKKYFRNVFN